MSIQHELPQISLINNPWNICGTTSKYCFIGVFLLYIICSIIYKLYNNLVFLWYQHLVLITIKLLHALKVELMAGLQSWSQFCTPWCSKEPKSKVPCGHSNRNGNQVWEWAWQINISRQDRITHICANSPIQIYPSPYFCALLPKYGK